ncbi:MAG TPA: Clp protease N-terminal domain-containing protein [Galbitalea sp.]|jgi:ATP-dependent Clp protease ATP-binding subunit ClpA|nr:Clp protease N-terminal domain-containing protein [Galbitalea sp.]
MSDSPIPLDNLIAYVRKMHEGAGPLDNLADAVRVAATIEEEADALIGYFVDQARRSGAPWSEIGASMGVSKQAVQKRFVTRVDESDIVPQGKLFERFTERARHTVAASRRIATAVGADGTNTDHLSTALLTEPQGFAARYIRDAEISNEQLLAAFDIDPDAFATAATVEAGNVPFDLTSKLALREALRVALRLGHNYIGTEHLLLGIIQLDGEQARKFTDLGVTVDSVEAWLTEAFEKHRAEGKGL